MLLLIYCLLIVAGSVAGGWVPLCVRLTHTRVQLALSFVGGVMLGVGLLHLVPHAFFALNSIHATMGWLLAGFLFVFFIERLFHFHHHDPVDEHVHDHDAGHHPHDHSHGPPRATGWGAALVGLSLHSVLDGIALAAGVAAEQHESPQTALAGLVVFLVVFLHKPFDSITLGALLATSSLPPQKRHVVNLLYALTVPLGVCLFLAGIDAAASAQQIWIGCALAFAGGTFLCISTSDLLPELQFHRHDRIKLSLALLLGIAFAAALVTIEESQHHHEHHEELHSH